MAYATVNRDGTHVDVQTLWTEKELVRQVPGARWDACGSRRWCLPLSWATCVTLRGVFGQQLDVDPNLNAWALDERRARIDPAMTIRAAIEPIDDGSPEMEVLRSWR